MGDISPLPMKVVVAYKYEKRILVILSQIVECCKELQHSEELCDACKIRLTKCNNLVKKEQIPAPYYILLVRTAIIERDKLT